MHYCVHVQTHVHLQTFQTTAGSAGTFVQIGLYDLNMTLSCFRLLLSQSYMASIPTTQTVLHGCHPDSKTSLPSSTLPDELEHDVECSSCHDHVHVGCLLFGSSLSDYSILATAHGTCTAF